jgi:hypothetical protein
MNRSEEYKQVVKAISNVQQSLEILKKDSKADVVKYSYTYTGMPTIWKALKVLLNQEKLTVVQSPVASDGNSMGDFLSTTIFHESGEWVQYLMRLVITRDDPQGFGSAITYAERYMLKTIFKVVTSDDDNDAVTQTLANGEMKKDWVRAYNIVAKKADPDKTPTYNDFINFVKEVYGKHPSQILAKDHQQVLETINAFNE